MSVSPRAEIERELHRIVDRLTSIPISRLPACEPQCRQTAELLVAHTRTVDPDVPNAPLPELQPHGLGALIAVVGADYLAVLDVDPTADEVLAALTQLRRTLP